MKAEQNRSSGSWTEVRQRHFVELNEALSENSCVTVKNNEVHLNTLRLTQLVFWTFLEMCQYYWHIKIDVSPLPHTILNEVNISRLRVLPSRRWCHLEPASAVMVPPTHRQTRAGLSGRSWCKVLFRIMWLVKSKRIRKINTSNFKS